MPIKLDHLEKLFQEQLKDAYSAESQLLEALPKLKEAASDPKLRKAFAKHLAETEGHVARLEKVCSQSDFSPLGQHCKAMEGLIAEGKDIIEDGEAEETVRDAALICAAQKVEHYEMALYGCLEAYATMLGRADAAELIAQTLEEEKAADVTLTEIAVGWVNAAAAETQA